ncbi:BTB domain-containing protein [Favolaschia claudopus]|uniref:BTB domain-containing protein n=1 Tax=Favolaschia claudopus TaxID=2862362 RepID=A0AAW0BFK1_9AGAR
MSTNADERINEPQQVSKLWFAPELVIIRAGDRVFRVFTGILKQKSSVFADMFTFPQPSSDSEAEMMDGVPVVTVYDGPAEMEVFLQAIYDSEFFMPPPKETEIEHCLAILRLAHKYDVPYLRRRALEHFDTMFPISLPEFIHRLNESEPGKLFNKSDVDEAFDALVATIAIATEVSASWLIPVVNYHLFRGWHIYDIITDGEWLTLNEDQRAVTIRAHSGLTRHWHEIFGFVSIAKTENDAQCRDWAKCNRERLSASRWINSHFNEHSTAALHILGERGWPKLCKSCLAEAKALHAAEKQKCWDELPGMFGLPGWRELEQMRKDAHGL